MGGVLLSVTHVVDSCVLICGADTLQLNIFLVFDNQNNSQWKDYRG